jgi:hypothetical protein
MVNLPLVPAFARRLLRTRFVHVRAGRVELLPLRPLHFTRLLQPRVTLSLPMPELGDASDTRTFTVQLVLVQRLLTTRSLGAVLSTIVDGGGGGGGWTGGSGTKTCVLSLNPYPPSFDALTSHEILLPRSPSWIV